MSENTTPPQAKPSRETRQSAKKPVQDASASPAATTQPPATPTGPATTLKAIFAQTGESRHLLLVGLYAGMGRDEIVTLRWDQLELTTGTIRFTVAGQTEPFELPLAAPLHALLTERRQADAEGVYVFPGRRAGTHRVGTRSVGVSVAKAAGTAFRIDDLPTLFRALAAQAGVPDDLVAWLVRDDIATRVANMEPPPADALRGAGDSIAARITRIAPAAGAGAGVAAEA